MSYLDRTGIATSVCVCSRRLPLGSAQFGQALHKGEHREGEDLDGTGDRETQRGRERDPKMCWTAVPVNSGSWQSFSIVATKSEPALHLTTCQWLNLRRQKRSEAAVLSAPSEDWSSYTFCHWNKSQVAQLFFHMLFIPPNVFISAEPVLIVPVSLKKSHDCPLLHLIRPKFNSLNWSNYLA